jgi:hypothetical protein
LFAAGESVQRINDIPSVNDLVKRIVMEAENVIRNVQLNSLNLSDP